MSDKSNRRSNIAFTVLWFLVPILLIILIFVTAHSSKREMREYVDRQIETVSMKQTKQMQHIQPMDGIDGKDGAPGRDGLPGKDGKDGTTTVIEQKTVVHETVTLPGEKGDPGRELQIQLNPETGDLETRYSGDTFWQVVIPCDKLQKDCTDGGSVSN